MGVVITYGPQGARVSAKFVQSRVNHVGKNKQRLVDGLHVSRKANGLPGS